MLLRFLILQEDIILCAFVIILGQGIAQILAQSGCHVVVCYHTDEKGAQETAQQVQLIGRQALIVQVDVGDENSVKNLFDKTLKQFNRLDIFVNNAGRLKEVE